MLIKFEDFNHANTLLSGPLSNEWNDIQEALESMPLHLKASSQKGIKGTPIFDVVAANQEINSSLSARHWHHRVVIPAQYAFMGTDIDFFKSGIIGEVQFSNYPFLLNNLIRSEMFYQAKVVFGGQPATVLVIITKAGILPASNSTLYYEQAVKQIGALTKNNVFDIPMRVVGLFSPVNVVIPVKWTTYLGERSRTVTEQVDRQATIIPGGRPNSRHTINLS